MKFSFPGASLAALSLLSLLSACASTNTPASASNGDANNKVATSDCEVVGPTIGSKLNRRSCAPAAPASAVPAAQPDGKQPSSTQ